MYRYKLIEYKAGATIEVIKCIPKSERKGYSGVRGKKVKKTKEEMQEANMRQAARKLAIKINANFKPGDWHLILTYKDPKPDRKQAQKNIGDFLSKLRKEYRKIGFELKYIQVTEYLHKRIHHHLIINHVKSNKKTTLEITRELWKDHGRRQFVPLYEEGEYKRLAEYMIKETEKTFRDEGNPSKQHYSCSRNLIMPKPERRIMTVKKKWDMNPKPRNGYYIEEDSLYNGFDKLGYPYQRYTMVKLNPVDADWEPCGEFLAEEERGRAYDRRIC